MQTFSAILAGFGSQLPEKRLTNDDLSRMVETNDEWIVQRTGIKERRLAAADESTATLATSAARKAIASAGLEPKDIELIICATITPEMVFPSTACFVGASLGLSGVPAFDMSAACSGFIYALVTGANFVRAGQFRNVLVIGAETLSRITDYTDRSSCILFGDGAGAVVIQRSSDPKRGLIYSSLHADGAGADAMKCIPGSRFPLTEAMIADRQQFMKIKGREVYKFAVTKFEELIQEGMRACELSADDLKLIIPHQVNQRIIDSAMEKLGLPADKAFVNIDRYGNTSAASIPIALDEAHRAGRFKTGDAIIFVAFGGGLTWANAVVRIDPMAGNLFILCPGQGAQIVGMGKALLETSATARDLFQTAARVLGFDLAAICVNGPEDRLNQTDISQPAIYVTSIASFKTSVESGLFDTGAVTAYAGLSLGEYTALHLAGTFGFEEGLRLVAQRGKFMQEAAVASPSGMVALIGADESAAKKICQEAAGGEVLVPANFNAPGQIVISGSIEACKRAVTAAEIAGLRAMPLKVAGAFHSPLMQPAADKMTAELAKVTFSQPAKTVYSNVTAQPHADSQAIKRLLVEQIVSPVRWEQTMQTLVAAADSRFIELAPGKTLAGLAKRINRRLVVESVG